jgi:uncharacterized protein YndB with AHSA1/START domain
MSYLQSPPGEDPVVVEGLFRASPARLWRAWTEPESLLRWFGPRAGCMVSADLDVREGGSWRVVVSEEGGERNVLEGAYLAVEPEARLSFTWRHVLERGDARDATPDSTVDIRFSAEGAATRVILRHEGVAKLDARQRVGTGVSPR